jgi:hypothetical protein
VRETKGRRGIKVERERRTEEIEVKQIEGRVRGKIEGGEMFRYVAKKNMNILEE